MTSSDGRAGRRAGTPAAPGSVGRRPSGLPAELDPRRARRPRSRRLLVLHWAGGLLSVAVFLLSVGGYVVVRTFTGNITHVAIRVPPGGRPAKPTAGVETFLFTGSDSRAGERAGSGVAGGRSDTQILVYLTPAGQVTMISFPRDLWLTIPAYTDAKGTTTPAHQAKINSAVGEGGPALLMQTMEQVTGIRVEHYVQVDFQGFRDISDALGGVTVCIKAATPAEVSYEKEPSGIYQRMVSTNLDDSYGGFRGVVGDNLLKGENALAFVRQRHGLPGGDFDRIKRQQAFLGSVVRQTVSARVLLNPIRTAELLKAVSGSLTLGDTSEKDLLTLGGRLRHLGVAGVRFQTFPTYVPADNESKKYGGAWVLLEDKAKATAMLNDMQGLAPAPPKLAPTVAVAPSAVALSVSNGTGRAGLATTTAAQLRSLGFTAAVAADTPAGVDVTEARYPPGMASAAATAAASVPGAVAQQDSSATGLVLVLGANFTSLRAVSPAVHTSTGGARGTPAAATTTAPNTAASPDTRCVY